MIDLVVVGAGGHGRELLDIVEAMNEVGSRFRIRGVVDEVGDPEGLLKRRGIPWLGDNAVLPTIEGLCAIGIGSGKAREKVAARLEEAGLEFVQLVHPTAVLGSDNRIGVGFVAAAQAQLTTNVEVGRHVHINVGATVSHDCRLGDYVTLSPGCHVSGNVTLEGGVTLGVGAVVRQGVVIGSEAIIGAGAVVVSDIPSGVTAIGIPARPV